MRERNPVNINLASFAAEFLLRQSALHETFIYTVILETIIIHIFILLNN